MRVKILDAWSWGLPIVSTAIGAEGIETEHEKNILIADTAESFAEAVIRILNDPTLAQQLGQNGRQRVLEKYNWRVTYSTWDKVYSGLFGNNATAE
jgi:glycosyltransferase involved in cell wall biosynthesis